MIFQNPASMLLVSALILIQFLLLTNSQVFPVQYFFPNETDLVAVNGSSSIGRCSNFIPSITRHTCITPNSSVLFDGNIPKLTGLDGDMWASQLLTINSTANTTEITFDFTATPDYTGVGRVEVVMFNCPEWGISVTTINLLDATSTSGSATFLTSIFPTTTSCNSLVRVCLSYVVRSTRPVLTLEFNLPSTSNWTHLVEVTFYASGSTCPPDTIITTPPTTPPPQPISTLPTTSSLKSPQHIVVTTPVTTLLITSTSITASSPIPNVMMMKETTTTSTENSKTTINETTVRNVTEIVVPSSDPTIVIISVVVATSIILIIVTIIVILILCKLYSTKHKNYKHNATTDTVLGESYTTRQQHNSHSERRHASLCKETGQVYYSTPEDGGGEADPSHQIYNRLIHDTHDTGGQSQDTEMHSTLQGNYEMGEYSTVSNCRQPHGGTGEEVSTADQLLPQIFYVQAGNNPIKKDEFKDIADPQEEWPPFAIYVQVDKKKSKKKEMNPPQTPQPYISLEQMYAQVGKKKSKKKEVSEDPPCKSGDVYSIVNKPSDPKIPQKSELLLEELNLWSVHNL